MIKIIFTLHALSRLKSRSISRNMVHQTISDLNYTFFTQDKKIYIFRSCRCYNLCIVTRWNQKKTRAVVITAFYKKN